MGTLHVDQGKCSERVDAITVFVVTSSPEEAPKETRSLTQKTPLEVDEGVGSSGGRDKAPDRSTTAAARRKMHVRYYLRAVRKDKLRDLVRISSLLPESEDPQARWWRRTRERYVALKLRRGFSRLCCFPCTFFLRLRHASFEEGQARSVCPISLSVDVGLCLIMHAL
jgi:hypothetical protein